MVNIYIFLNFLVKMICSRFINVLMITLSVSLQRTFKVFLGRSNKVVYFYLFRPKCWLKFPLVRLICYLCVPIKQNNRFRIEHLVFTPIQQIPNCHNYENKCTSLKFRELFFFFKSFRYWLFTDATNVCIFPF